MQEAEQGIPPPLQPPTHPPECEALPALASEGRRGAEAALVSRGPTVPLSHNKNTFPQRLGKRNVNNRFRKTQTSAYTRRFQPAHAFVVKAPLHPPIHKLIVNFTMPLRILPPMSVPRHLYLYPPPPASTAPLPSSSCRLLSVQLNAQYGMAPDHRSEDLRRYRLPYYTRLFGSAGKGPCRGPRICILPCM